MKHAYLFDIDGVLCEPQQKMSKEMLAAIQSIPTTEYVFFVTGNSYTKAVDLLDGSGMIFCNNADELRGQYGGLMWQDTETPPLPDEFLNKLWIRMKALNIRPDAIERRSPKFMNYCPLGRFLTQEQRSEANKAWRKDFIDDMKTDAVEVVIGGQVSVDIYSKGADKSRAGKWLNDNGYTFTFFGDKTAPGGNDYPLAKYCEDHPENKCITVSGPAETLEILESL